jgi:hypothetical protein
MIGHPPNISVIAIQMSGVHMYIVSLLTHYSGVIARDMVVTSPCPPDWQLPVKNIFTAIYS